MINTVFAHSNIINVSSTINFSETGWWVSFFDKEDELIIKHQLWWLTDTILWTLDLMLQVISETKMAALAENFSDKFKDVKDKNGKHMKLLE